MLDKGYAVHSGRKLPLVDAAIRNGRIELTFSKYMPGLVEWNDADFTEVFDAQGRLAFIHPGRYGSSFRTMSGTFTPTLDVVVNELEGPGGRKWTRVR